jgi:hypothetical protein
MVYQIYFGDRGTKDNVLFDIEVYLRGDGRCHWCSEIHSHSFGSAFINYFKSDDMKAILENDAVLSNMIEDSKELEELRGWLYECTDNTPMESSLASKRHKNVLAYVKEKVYAFADKYNLYVNED